MSQQLPADLLVVNLNYKKIPNFQKPDQQSSINSLKIKNKFTKRLKKRKSPLLSRTELQKKVLVSKLFPLIFLRNSQKILKIVQLLQKLLTLKNIRFSEAQFARKKRKSKNIYQLRKNIKIKTNLSYLIWADHLKVIIFLFIIKIIIDYRR